MKRYASPEINRLDPHPLGEWVHWKDHIDALDAEHDRIRPLLERCLERLEVARAPYYDGVLVDDLRAELGKES